jgi:hypothetical protein
MALAPFAHGVEHGCKAIHRAADVDVEGLCNDLRREAAPLGRQIEPRIQKSERDRAKTRLDFGHQRRHLIAICHIARKGMNFGVGLCQHIEFIDTPRGRSNLVSAPREFERDSPPYA